MESSLKIIPHSSQTKLNPLGSRAVRANYSNLQEAVILSRKMKTLGSKTRN